MILPVYERFITDASGNVIPFAEVEIRDQSGALADLFLNADGTGPTTNPATANAEGKIRVFLAPGLYNVTATGPAGAVDFEKVLLHGNLADKDEDYVTRALPDITALSSLNTDALVDGQAFNVNGSKFRYDSGTGDFVLLGSVTVEAFGMPITTASFQAALDSDYKKIKSLSEVIEIDGSVSLSKSGKSIDLSRSEIVYSGSQDDHFLSVTGERNSISLNFDGSGLCSWAVELAGGSNTVHDGSIENLHSEAGGTRGVYINEVPGCTVKRMDIRNLSAASSGQSGDAGGASRGVYYNVGSDVSKKTRIIDCDIENVSGDDGDGIQIFSSKNPGDHHADANVLIARCNIEGATRRAIKIQASDVRVADGVFRQVGASDGTPYVDAINCKNVKILRNDIYTETTRACVIQGTDVDCEDCAASWNTIETVGDNNVALVIDTATRCTATFNDINSKFHGLVAIRSTKIVLGYNGFSGPENQASGSRYIEASGSCDGIVTVGNYSVSGGRTRLIQAGASNSVVSSNIAMLSDPNFQLVVAGDSHAGSCYTDNIAFSSNAVTGGDANEVVFSQNVCMGGGVSTSPPVIYTTESPQNLTTSVVYSRGTLAMNRSADATPPGWRCTVSGSPGTWVPL